MQYHACVNSFEFTPSLPWVYSSIFAQEEFSHVSLCPFVFGWLHFQLEEESLFRLHPVVSGSFHWEHHTFNKAYYFSPPESLCSRRLLSCVGMLLKEVIDSKALVLTTQYYRFEIEKI